MRPLTRATGAMTLVLTAMLSFESFNCQRTIRS